MEASLAEGKEGRKAKSRNNNNASSTREERERQRQEEMLRHHRHREGGCVVVRKSLFLSIFGGCGTSSSSWSGWAERSRVKEVIRAPTRQVLACVCCGHQDVTRRNASVL